MSDENEQPPKRAIGRLRKYVRIHPEHYPRIEEMWVRDPNISKIAREFGCNESSIRKIMQRHIFPAAKMSMGRSIEAELIRLQAVETAAWKEYASAPIDKKPAFLNTALKAIEARCKIEGHFAPKRIQVEIDEFRVAGMKPDGVDQEMLEYIHAKIVERKEYEQRLADAENNIVDGEVIGDVDSV